MEKMVWFIAAVISLVLGLFYKKSHGEMSDIIVSDGEIIRIDAEKKEIIVRYTVGDKTTDFKANENYDDFSKLKIGQKVLVSSKKNAPEVPLAVLYNMKAKDRSLKGSQNATFIISAVCFVMGIVSVI